MGWATISRLLKITGLFCRISSLLKGSFAKETCNFNMPTNRSLRVLVVQSGIGYRALFRGYTALSIDFHQEPYNLSKEPYNLSKEPYNLALLTHGGIKEPYVLSF